MTFVEWARTSHARHVVWAVCVWLTCDNLYRGITTLVAHHEAHTAIQTARMYCESHGGFYGAMNGGKERCFGLGTR